MTRLIISIVTVLFFIASPAFPLSGEMQEECYVKNEDVREAFCRYFYLNSLMTWILDSKVGISDIINTNLEKKLNSTEIFDCDEMTQLFHQTNEKVEEIVSAVEELTGLPIETFVDLSGVSYEQLEKDFCEKGAEYLRNSNDNNHNRRKRK